MAFVLSHVVSGLKALFGAAILPLSATTLNQSVHFYLTHRIFAVPRPISFSRRAVEWRAKERNHWMNDFAWSKKKRDVASVDDWLIVRVWCSLFPTSWFFCCDRQSFSFSMRINILCVGQPIRQMNALIAVSVSLRDGKSNIRNPLD